MSHDIFGDDVVNISSGDAAGGDLTGSFPNPNVATVLTGKVPLTQTTALVLATRAINSASVTSFTVSPTDFWIKVDGTTAAVTATLPTAASVAGRVVFFKETSGGHTLTVLPGASEKIDGNNSKTISNAFAGLISDGTNWYTFVA